jgi:hypothetical protein
VNRRVDVDVRVFVLIIRSTTCFVEFAALAVAGSSRCFGQLHRIEEREVGRLATLRVYSQFAEIKGHHARHHDIMIAEMRRDARWIV